ncbi:hypothetical protein [Amycolatopsis sp. NBC_01480]|uniref:hypothetical protein n=1 Tax=Amycolatopsis sp. NBC_01480 TaxID=2903562 RepID=UPI002E2844DA|nr:hypothetical protein [Amycolatopsis sp. NBC_01480]
MTNQMRSWKYGTALRRPVTVALLIAILTACVSTQAGAASRDTTAGTPGVMVTTYEAVNIRQTPWSTSKLLGSYPANATMLGFCWAHGEPISDNGVVNNDIWVSTGVLNGVKSYFISAVYLKGDSLGGMPVGAQCP